MSSLPNYSNLADNYGKRHRHRRSAAISGDFDAMGLGLYSSTNQINNSLMIPIVKADISNIKDTDDVGKPITKRSESMLDDIGTYDEDINYNCNDDDDLDKHFQFNNEADFSNKPTSDSYTFPTKTPEIPGCSSFSINSYCTPKRSHTSALHSPIKLSHKKAASTSSTPKTRFFLTEETTFNHENIPDAVIDLDQVLDANLPPVTKQSGIELNHKRTKLTPSEYLTENDFLSSPFSKVSGSPRICSPLSVVNNTLFQQPIQELVNDDAEDGLSEAFYDNQYEDSSQMEKDFGNTMISPLIRAEKLYSSSSANTSTSSLPSHKTSDKGFSIYSGANDHLAHSKRSGAKANRYQSFYDQTWKVSNALKVASSESVDLARSNSFNRRIQGSISTSHESKSLGHASSYPNFKSNQLKKKNFSIANEKRTRIIPPLNECTQLYPNGTDTKETVKNVRNSENKYVNPRGIKREDYRKGPANNIKDDINEISSEMEKNLAIVGHLTDKSEEEVFNIEIPHEPGFTDSNDNPKKYSEHPLSHESAFQILTPLEGSSSTRVNEPGVQSSNPVSISTPSIEIFEPISDESSHNNSKKTSYSGRQDTETLALEDQKRHPPDLENLEKDPSPLGGEEESLSSNSPISPNIASSLDSDRKKKSKKILGWLKKRKRRDESHPQSRMYI